VIALAADELLRASWAELALPRAPPPLRPLSSQARTAVERSTEPPTRHGRLALGIRGGAEWWTGGLALYGGDGVLEWRLSPRVALGIAAGARAAPEASSSDGTVAARVLSARAGAALTLSAPGSGPAVLVAGSVGAHAVTLMGDAGPEAAGASRTAAALTLALGPGLRVPLGSLGTALVLDASGAAALHGVRATDSGAAVTGLSGFAAVVTLGVLAEAL